MKKFTHNTASESGLYLGRPDLSPDSKTVRTIKIFLFSLIFFIFPQTQAVEIQDLEVIPDDRHISIQWTALPDNIMNQVEGYAVQWSNQLSDIGIDEIEHVKRWGTNKDNIIPSMLTSTVFDGNETYYVRIYTWTRGGERNRERILGNGSQALKFTLNSLADEITESEYITISDPVIIVDTDDEDEDEDDEVNFGKIRVSRYDDHAVFSWSRANISTTYANGRKFTISENNDLSDPIAEFNTALGTLSVKIKGLTPSTKYYFQGAFYKSAGGEDRLFGQSEIESITMMRPMSKDEKSRIELLRRRGILKSPVADITRTVGDAITDSDNDNSTNQNNDDDDEDDDQQNTGDTSAYTKAEVLAKIRSLETELQIWKNRYKAMTGSASYNAYTKKPTPLGSKTKAKLSLRERLMRLTNR